jgi:hypothetical protein
VEVSLLTQLIEVPEIKLAVGGEEVIRVLPL